MLMMVEMGRFAGVEPPVVGGTPFLEARMGTFPNAHSHSAGMREGGGFKLKDQPLLLVKMVWSPSCDILAYTWG